MAKPLSSMRCGCCRYLLLGGWECKLKAGSAGAGMFVRACKLTGMQGDQRTDGELLKDVQELRSALEGELRIVSGAASGEVPGSAGAALWLGSEEAEAAASALRPKLANAQKAIEALLIEVVTLEVHHLLLTFPNPS